MAKKNNITVLPAFTYHTTRHLSKFNNLCNKKGIKPIIGISTKIKFKERNFILNFIALNKDGYSQLNYISSLTTDQESINLDDLLIFLNENLITIINFYKEFDKEKLKKLEEIITLIFKKNSPIGIGVDKPSFRASYLEFLKKNYPYTFTVSFDPILFLRKFEQKPCSILQQIRKKNLPPDEKKTKLHSWEEIYHLQQYENTHKNGANKIINACKTFTISPFLNNHLPFAEKENPEKFQHSLSILKKKIISKVAQRQLSSPYKKRIQSEMDKISKNCSLANEYLLAAHIADYCKKKSILIWGRGSINNSLIAYILDITRVNPMKYNLQFEYFFREQKTDLADIDIDIQSSRKKEVEKHLLNLYKQNIFQKKIPQKIGFLAALKAILEKENMSQDNKKRIWENAGSNKKKEENLIIKEKFKEVFEIANQLSQIPAHYVIHPTSYYVANANEQLSLFSIEKKKSQIRKIPVPQLEDFFPRNWIKIDLLSSKYLDCLYFTLTLIKKIDRIPAILHEKKSSIFKMINNIDTIGIFQLESNYAKNVLQQLQISNFADLVISISFLRPGLKKKFQIFTSYPRKEQKIISNFLVKESNQITINNQFLNEKKSIDYPIIFREQLSNILHSTGLFTTATVDQIIKIKKKSVWETKDKQFLSFLEKKIEKLPKNASSSLGINKFKNLWNEEIINKSYNFSKSHAIAYAELIYLAGYLKLIFPTAFYFPLLHTLNTMNLKEKIKQIKEVNSIIKIPYLDSQLAHKKEITLYENLIFIPLAKIIPSSALAAVISSSYHKDGKFKNFFEFCLRTDIHKYSSKNLECLIYSGYLDKFDCNRTRLAKNMTTAINFSKTFANSKKFDHYPLIIHKTQKWEEERIMEKNFLSIILRKEKCIDKLDKYGERIQFSHLSLYTNKEILIGGIISNLHISPRPINKLIFTFADSPYSSLSLNIKNTQHLLLLKKFINEYLILIKVTPFNDGTVSFSSLYHSHHTCPHCQIKYPIKPLNHNFKTTENHSS